MDQTQAGNPMKSLLRRPAHELAEMVRSGEISARELTEAALRQIEADRDLNAFTLVDADAALAAADAIKPGDPRPFAGVPTAIKELHAVAGQQFTMGSNIYGEYGTTYDSYVVRRIRDAGFISVGRTSAPEFGIVPVDLAQALRPHAQSVGPQPLHRVARRAARRRPSRRGRCPSRMRPMAQARSASQRRPAGWWA